MYHMIVKHYSEGGKKLVGDVVYWGRLLEIMDGVMVHYVILLCIARM